MSACLITAGATRNPVDAIRYLSAGSTGRTGVTLARRLAEDGLQVTLLASPEAVLRCGPHPAIAVETFGSTRDLQAKMRAWSEQHATCTIVHAAAVGDYEAPPEVSKIESGRSELVLRLRPAPKILDGIRGWGHTGLLVSFKAAAPETTHPQLVQIARAQLQRTDSSLVFANVIGRTGRDVVIVGADTETWFEARGAALSALADAVVGRGT